MTKKKDRSIHVSPATFLNKLLWNATRYCIGRQSYVSSYAFDFIQLINDNRDKLSEVRLREYANDIRREISHRVKFTHGILIEGNSYRVDAYTLFCTYIYGRGIKSLKELAQYDYLLNVKESTVQPLPASDPIENEKSFASLLMWHDLNEWAKLANSIDRLFNVVCKYDGKVEEIVAYSDMHIDIRQDQIQACYKLHPLDGASSPSIYIAPEHIIKKTPLFD